MTRKIQLKVREHIIKQAVTQRVFAHRTGLREATISQMVNNNYKRVELEHLLIIMDYLKISDFNEILEIVDED